MGGLGNQMFQYAAARRLAHIHNTQVKIDFSWFAHQSDSDRQYELNHFRLKQSFVTNSDRVRFRIHTIGKIDRILGTVKTIFRNPRPYDMVFERNSAFDPKILTMPDNIALVGYWQSYQYFDDIRSVLINEFSPLEPLCGKDKEIAGRIEEVSSVAVHIRRGDYNQNPKASQFHGCCNAEYYQKAIEYISQHIKRPHFFIFSDDMLWAKQNIRTMHSITFVDHNTPNYGWRDLNLMRLCKHNIIANSSFSWWAAWLNTSIEKLIVGPKQYYVKKAQNRRSKDLFPSYWVRL
jgi:hypothetical protein